MPGILVLATGIVSLLGILISKKMNVHSQGNGLQLVQIEEFWKNLQACITGIFQIINASPINKAVKALSIEGIVALLKIVFTIILIVMSFINVSKLFKKDQEIGIKQYLSILFPWNLFVMLFIDTRAGIGNTNSEYRYFLIGFVPLIILFIIQYSDWVHALQNKYSRAIMMSVILLPVIFLTYESDRDLTKYKKDTIYINNICDCMDKLDDSYDFESVFFVANFGPRMSDMCRNLDREHIYCTYSVTDGFVIKDYYQKYMDNFSHSKGNVVVIYAWDDIHSYFPPYIADNYTKIDTVNSWFGIYYSPVNLLDGIAGLPVNGTYRDYFYDYGYYQFGEITNNGAISITGNNDISVYSDPFVTSGGTYDVTLYYDTMYNQNEVIGTFEIFGENISYQTYLDAEDTHITLKDCNFDGKDISIKIIINEENICNLRYIEYSKKK